MKLRQKIILFAITPLLLALGAISATVSYQADSLAQQEQRVIRTAYIETKDSELKNYVALATLAISHLYKSGKSDTDTKNAAKAILEKLEYSVDGYFFVYDFEGTMLVHPKQKERIGKNMMENPDLDEKKIVQDLIELAKKGGGFYDYLYKKFSTGSSERKPKRAYAIALPAWGWMLGTGVYLDDIDVTLEKIDKKASNNITSTMLSIFAITVLSLLMVISLGLALNIWEQRDTQEKVRKRIARELHDGICQKLGAIKYNVEAAIFRFTSSTPDKFATKEVLEEIVGRIKKINAEVRGFSHELYAQILTDIGLESAIRELVYDYPATPIDFVIVGEVNNLSTDTSWALYKIAQVALENVQNHAKAHQIILRLEGSKHHVTLSIIDDGVGFDFNQIKYKSGTGLGLRSMQERLEDERVDGTLDLESSPKGTVLTAIVPRKPRNRLLINLFPWKKK
jgi:two-component system NarL family sensor kinase